MVIYARTSDSKDHTLKVLWQKGKNKGKAITMCDVELDPRKKDWKLTNSVHNLYPACPVSKKDV